MLYAKQNRKDYVRKINPQSLPDALNAVSKEPSRDPPINKINEEKINVNKKNTHTNILVIYLLKPLRFLCDTVGASNNGDSVKWKSPNFIVVLIYSKFCWLRAKILTFIWVVFKVPHRRCRKGLFSLGRVLFLEFLFLNGERNRRRPSRPREEEEKTDNTRYSLSLAISFLFCSATQSKKEGKKKFIVIS